MRRDAGRVHVAARRHGVRRADLVPLLPGGNGEGVVEDGDLRIELVEEGPEAWPVAGLVDLDELATILLNNLTKQGLTWEPDTENALRAVKIAAERSGSRFSAGAHL